MNLPINECPYCGCPIFYRKDYMSGPSWYLASNVQEVDNGGMYDHLRQVVDKWWYCKDCNKRVFEDAEVE